jgi:hypothetical protein
MYFAEAMDAAEATGLLQVGSIDLSAKAAGGAEPSDSSVDTPATGTFGGTRGKR